MSTQQSFICFVCRRAILRCSHAGLQLINNGVKKHRISAMSYSQI